MKIIDQLKKNEKPFDSMSEEMQEKLKTIVPKDIECVQAPRGAREWNSCRNYRITDIINHSTNTYRLRPDYAEKPEIVECEIALDDKSDIWGYQDPQFGEFINVDLACNCPEYRLLGFKFGGLKQVINKAVGYSHNDVDILPFVQYDDLKSGKYKVLHATHVLFRKGE